MRQKYSCRKCGIMVWDNESAYDVLKLCGVCSSSPPPWTPCDKALPPDGVVVETKVDDDGGVRNNQELKRQGRLWFVPDGAMYVYYQPTHWRMKGVK